MSLWPNVIRWQLNLKECIKLRHSGGWLASLVLIGLLGCSIAALITCFCPHYVRDHDEFSNLLAADTLLNGRLANPTPEVWEPLQSFHVIFEPSYASKYPLGPAILIALGWAVFGVPIAGSWLAAGICAPTMMWMAAGLVPRRWALLIGLLVALHPSMQVTWSQSLFGGWLTASGAALVAGGIVRLRRRVAWHPCMVAGLGVSILALSRPFEGIVFTCVAAFILWTSWQECWQRRLSRSLHCCVYASVPVVAGLILIAAQNVATTGKLTCMPYQIHEANYGAAPLFVFGSEKVSNLQSTGQVPRTVAEYHQGWSLDFYRERNGALGFVNGIGRTGKMIFGYWGMSFVLIPLAFAPFVLSHKLPRSIAIGLMIQVLASASVCWIFPHYLSPALAWLVLLTAVSIRAAYANLRRKRFPLLRWGVYGLLATQVVLLCLATGRLMKNPNNDWARHRFEVTQWLQMHPGKQLVFVDYASDHNVHQEWVYNRANLEVANIIWARGERPEWRQELIERYKSSHQLWEFNPDSQTLPSRLPVISSPKDTDSDVELDDERILFISVDET